MLWPGDEVPHVSTINQETINDLAIECAADGAGLPKRNAKATLIKRRLTYSLIGCSRCALIKGNGSPPPMADVGAKLGVNRN